ncbi:hypothetical protein [Cytobacillus firmus]|uniref:hypothetical protein n=1 Tax=Cytobacillus firmus TaxID=1399 RepID=UPI001C97B11A|nr:hypothetical protein [Cytobacillus firmus]MBY6053266.1 hypothetical protein [Cytobacillus firmus]
MSEPKKEELELIKNPDVFSKKGWALKKTKKNPLNTTSWSAGSNGKEGYKGPLVMK